jgi:hypothetical protein
VSFCDSDVVTRGWSGVGCGATELEDVELGDGGEETSRQWSAENCVMRN